MADPARLAAYDVLRAVRTRRRLRQPGARRRRSASHGLTGGTPAFATELAAGHAAPAGHLRRRHRRLPRPRHGEAAGARRAAARHPPAAGDAGPHARRGQRPRSTWPAPQAGPAPAGLVNAVLRKVAEPRPRRLGRAGRPRRRPPTRSATSRSPTATRAGSSRSCAQALGERRRARRAAGRRQRAAAGGAGRPARPVDAWTSCRASRPRSRRTASGWPAGDPGAVPGGGRGPRRGPGRGLPAGRPRARGGAARRAATTRWLDLCAGPGRQGRAAGGAGGASEARGWSPTSRSSTAPSWWPAGAGRRRRGGGGHRPPTARSRRWPPASFDRVLVDAPCSGLGALRRRPEARWRKQPADLDDARAAAARPARRRPRPGPTRGRRASTRPARRCSPRPPRWSRRCSPARR